MAAAREDGAGSLLVRLGVGAATEALRLAGVGRSEYKRQRQRQQGEEAEAEEQRRAARSPSDARSLLRSIRADFDRSYFVTGDVDPAVYEPDCVFADPTIQFTGFERYRRNLQLVVPFLVRPAISLRSLRELPPAERPGGAPALHAAWQLRTGVALPWQPYIVLNGTTTYFLNSQGSRVCRHVEAWDVTPLQALLALLRPARESGSERQGQCLSRSRPLLPQSRVQCCKAPGKCCEGQRRRRKLGREKKKTEARDCGPRGGASARGSCGREGSKLKQAWASEGVAVGGSKWRRHLAPRRVTVRGSVSRAAAAGPGPVCRQQVGPGPGLRARAGARHPSLR